MNIVCCIFYNVGKHEPNFCNFSQTFNCLHAKIFYEFINSFPDCYEIILK